MTKPTTKRGRPPETKQVKKLKYEIKKQIVELGERYDTIRAHEDRIGALIARVNHLESKLGPVAKLVEVHPPLVGDDEVDQELIGLRRLIAILEDIDPAQRRRLLAMVDARYFDQGGVK